MGSQTDREALGRRQFFGLTARRGAGLALAGGALPTLLAACARDEGSDVGQGSNGGGTSTSAEEAAEQARAVVGDVIDFSLSPDGWDGAFGFVTMKLHTGAFDGNDIYFVRTDTSDQQFATAEKLVFVPKLAPLATADLSGSAFLIENGTSGQPTVFSSEPGKDDYTPAWTIHRAKWTGNGDPQLLRSVAEVLAAERGGALTVEKTKIVVNYGVVKWSSGAMPVDNEKKEYLGKGQLLEEPDTSGGRVTFKLGECYPNNRYFVLDHSMAPMAEMTSTAFSPRLQDGPTQVGATGRTNVFMNGVEGPGPMGFQPSVFDFSAGNPAWSPYWDHFAYSWKDGATPELITDQTKLFAARDAGDLEEFPGVPDTKGTVFTVNCPVPVVAPNTFSVA